MKAQREARIVKGLAERMERASSRVNEGELYAGCPDYNKKEWREVAGGLSLEDVMDITERVGGSWEDFKAVADDIQRRL